MKLKNNCVVFNNGFTVTLHRTVRLPEDGNSHSLPPSMGSFPMKMIEDYKDKVPQVWKEHSGVFIPMFEREAMWLGFSGPTSAIKVATGKINAVSGGTWKQELQAPVSMVDGKDPEQDYMVSPHPQPWLDGFNIGGGQIRQFVGMQMGKGYTVEAQVSGKEDIGGIQVLVVPSKPGKIPTQTSGTRGLSYSTNYSAGPENFESSICLNDSSAFAPACAAVPYQETKTSYSINANSVSRSASSKKSFTKASEIGLAQGARLEQKVYADPYGVDAWDQEKSERLFIHIINAELWEKITGEKCPNSPVSASEYKGAYFTYENGNKDLKGSGTLANVKPISQKDKEHGFEDQQDDSLLEESKTNPVINLKSKIPAATVVDKSKIKDGVW